MKIPEINDVFTYDFIFSKAQIYEYAQISGDTNPVHLSESYAEKTVFERCIVHGYFSISIFSKIYGTLLYPEGHILISQSAKYLQPIFTEVPYTAVFTTKALFPEKNRVLYQNEIIEKSTGNIKVTGDALLLNRELYLW